jgi:hypothetical protein
MLSNVSKEAHAEQLAVIPKIAIADLRKMAEVLVVNKINTSVVIKSYKFRVIADERRL